MPLRYLGPFKTWTFQNTESIQKSMHLVVLPLNGLVGILKLLHPISKERYPNGLSKIKNWPLQFTINCSLPRIDKNVVHIMESIFVY